MDETTRKKILQILDQHRLMTVATNRPDGWPQATTVGFVNDGLRLYCLCSPQSQKAKNLKRDRRTSLTIDHDTANPMEIIGLSMAAVADPVSDPTEIGKAMGLLGAKFPEYAALSLPKEAEILIFRLSPHVISVLDYSKGFGHADLVTL
jgi:hypothetical protein